MPLPSLPQNICIQCNWQLLPNFAWDQANANLVGDCATECVAITNLIQDTIPPDTCRIVCLDQAKNLVPYNAASVVYPYVEPGVPVRVLERDPGNSAVWVPRYYGYITSIQPIADPDVAPLWVEIELESPMVYLAEHVVTLPARAAGAAVRDAMQDLLDAVIAVTGLRTNYFALDAWHRNAGLPGAWGGGEATFGQALVELLKLAGAQAACEPLWATGSGQLDWRLHIWQATTTAAGTWSAAAGDMHVGSTLTYRHGAARAA